MGFSIGRFMNSVLFNSGGVAVLAHVVLAPALLLVTMMAAELPATKHHALRRQTRSDS
jgi:hypothetical protein